MNIINQLIITITSLFCFSCNLFHQTGEFEMERLSEDVLSQKNGKGISITVVPIEEKKP